MTEKSTVNTASGLTHTIQHTCANIETNRVLQAARTKLSDLKQQARQLREEHPRTSETQMRLHDVTHEISEIETLRAFAEMCPLDYMLLDKADFARIENELYDIETTNVVAATGNA